MCDLPKGSNQRKQFVMMRNRSATLKEAADRTMSTFRSLMGIHKKRYLIIDSFKNLDSLVIISYGVVCNSQHSSDMHRICLIKRLRKVLLHSSKANITNMVQVALGPRIVSDGVLWHTGKTFLLPGREHRRPEQRNWFDGLQYCAQISGTWGTYMSTICLNLFRHSIGKRFWAPLTENLISNISHDTHKTYSSEKNLFVRGLELVQHKYFIVDNPSNNTWTRTDCMRTVPGNRTRDVAFDIPSLIPQKGRRKRKSSSIF